MAFFIDISQCFDAQVSISSVQQNMLLCFRECVFSMFTRAQIQTLNVYQMQTFNVKDENEIK